jgi:hypothetical protein
MDATTQQQYAETFHGLHRKGDPLILFNAWDVATAKAIANTSPAVATSSWAVASALGYADGEDVPYRTVAIRSFSVYGFCVHGLRVCFSSHGKQIACRPDIIRQRG